MSFNLETLKFYHIQLKFMEKQKASIGDMDVLKIEWEYDLSEGEVTTFATQYIDGCVFFKGKSIPSISIKEIEIRESEKKFLQTFNFLNISAVVTRRFINSPSKIFLNQSISTHTTNTAQPKIASKNVFIVHGNDHIPMKELKTMLFELGLNPIVLHDQPSGGSNTLIEKFEKHSDVSYAFVILTPDDIGGSYQEVDGLAQRGLTPTAYINELFNGRYLLKRRARQNVVLEFGYFINKLGRSRVCCLHKGNVEIPSDMSGIMYIPFNGSLDANIRLQIMKELKNAGFDTIFQ